MSAPRSRHRLPLHVRRLCVGMGRELAANDAVLGAEPVLKTSNNDLPSIVLEHGDREWGGKAAVS